MKIRNLYKGVNLKKNLPSQMISLPNFFYFSIFFKLCYVVLKFSIANLSTTQKQCHKTPLFCGTVCHQGSV